jgi:tetratricopeptide (TPR) repeat protein
MNDCINMHERALQYKIKVLPEYHVDILSSYLSCAQALLQMSDWDKATQYFIKAYEISKNINGEFDIQSS